MTGTCAPRSVRSWLAALAVRAAFVGGLCVGGWLGGTSIAAATELPEFDQPRIEVEPLVLDPAPAPEVDRPEPPQVEVPVPPIDETDQAAATVDEPGSTPPVPPTPPPNRQRSVEPPNADHAAPLPKQTAVHDATVQIIPKPRAPDAPAPSHAAPLTSPKPAPQEPSPPATSLSAGTIAGFSGLRGLLVILPTGPNLSDPAVIGAANPETRPLTGIPSFEPSASPD
ncbi:hypothetical protein MOQ72_27345 [Saccharopolyspora sp. K220]|uniref:hypothetical protein n=1 Tax=Saccharopolyspora soli TaxID=2926618 RepID=UPI001F5872C6|nr:hypothetical protein [Saccharopolyspora soli]MCI2421165.1 hypothetical protein [Saccharopolyspora soli]